LFGCSPFIAGLAAVLLNRKIGYSLKSNPTFVDNFMKLFSHFYKKNFIITFTPFWLFSLTI
jgi:ribose/xylose/arabinose/galactoside ABC-type transport system permease subunit